MDSTLSSERAEQISTLFDALVDLAPNERAAYLDEACADDADLRRQVEALLKADDQADEVLHKLDRPVLDVPDRLIGQRVSHYRIIEKLGGGGMGVVYKARDLKLKRTVALKFLPPDWTRDDDARQRFEREAQAASALDHTNIGTIYEIDTAEDGRLFIAMAFYAGLTLKKKISQGPLPVEEAVDYAIQMAEGLSQAHEAGITHRDIKPANVMVTERGLIKIVDFGLAKAQDVSLTQTGTTLGTTAYMSPEQALGQKVDQRTDLWSLGVVLYEMLMNERPFQGDHAQAIIYAIRHDAPKPVPVLRPEVPEVVSQVVEKLLKKDPAERYGQAEEVLADLKSLHRILERARPESGLVSTPSSRRPRVLLYGSVALLLILLLLVGQALFKGSQAPIDSIAVLPMKNLSGNPDQDYFADGMTDQLINNLSRLSGLDRVISRTSMMRYKGSDKSMQEIGRELGVDVLVEASVMSDSAQVIITVNLIEAGTERGLWGDSYERPWRDVLKLQSEMALAIAQEIAVALTPQEEARLAEAPEVNPEAYDLYIRGLQAQAILWNNPQATAYFGQAIAIDSSFAPAYAELAIEYALMGGFNLLPGGEVKARQLAEKALSLDPSLSEPYTAIGLVRELVGWDWPGAEEAFRRAIELNPRDAFAHHELGQLWMRLGRFEEALASEKQALYLDPLSARYQSGVGEIYLYSRRYDEAIVELEKGRELGSSDIGYLAVAYWQTSMYEEACRLLEAFGGSEVGPLARPYAVICQRENALEVLEDMKARWAQGKGTPNNPWEFAWIYASLGEKDQALDWLDRAYQARIGILIYVKVDPGFYPLHGEPRFQALLEKMGLDG